MQEAEVRNVKKFTQIKSSQKLEEFTSKLLYLTKLNVLLHFLPQPSKFFIQVGRG